MRSEDFLRCETGGEEIEHHRDPDAMPTNAGTATAAGGIDPDMGVGVFVSHGGEFQGGGPSITKGNAGTGPAPEGRFHGLSHDLSNAPVKNRT